MTPEDALNGRRGRHAPVSRPFWLAADSDGPDDSNEAEAAQEAQERARARALARYSRALDKATTRPQMQRALDRLLIDLERAGDNRPVADPTPTGQQARKRHQP